MVDLSAVLKVARRVVKMAASTVALWVDQWDFSATRQILMGAPWAVLLADSMAALWADQSGGPP